MASRRQGRNSGLFRRAAFLAAAVLGVFVALGAPTAVAGTVSYDGDAVVFTGGDHLDHELQFRLDGNNDDIIDSEPITSYPNDCTPIGTNPTTRVVCPGSPAVRVELGEGRDRVYFNGTSDQAGDCFLRYDIRLGNGSNENFMRTDCPDPATATITAGLGNDTLRGGSPGTSTTIFAGGGGDDVGDGLGDDVIHGGEGDDRVFGFLGDDQVYGEGGNDRLGGGEGNDVEDGGPGDDDINYDGIDVLLGAPDPGADQFRGGGGRDLLRLYSDTVGMAISIDGQANDGRPGEGDNVGSDIEQISGTLFADVFNGSAGADGFNGSAGNDEIHGAGGNDDLRGSDSEDRVFGDAGDDFVEGGYDADVVDGGPGNDGIFGDIFGCSASCIPDEDQLFARDGERDVVNCGGPGSAQVDQLDTVAGGCVSVDRQNVGGGGAAPAKASFASSKRSIKVSRSGRFSYSFRAGARLSGKAVFRSVKKVRTSRRARVTLAAKSFKVPGSGKVTLKIKLSPKKLAILRRNRRIKTRVTVTLKNAAGRSSVASTTVTLRR